jgi:chemotaxis protein histidine kinase CheA
MGEAVANLASPTDREERLKKLRRDLHTLKGEATLLGVEPIQKLAHAAEDLLDHHESQQGIGDDTADLLYRCLDAIYLCVESGSQQGPMPQEDIDRALSALHAAMAGHETTGRSESRSALPKSALEEPPPGPEGAPMGAPLDANVETNASASRVADAASGTSSRLLRVDLKDLDQLSDLAHDVILGVSGNRGYIAELREVSRALSKNIDELRQRTNSSTDAYAANAHKLSGLVRGMRENDFALELTCSKLSHALRELRLQPLRSVFATYPAFVRLAAQDVHKRIEVRIVGEDFGVDQRVIEEVAEPLLHVVRNAIVHGIELPADRRRVGKPETGTITIEARQDGDSMHVVVSDDGRGIDTAKVRERAVNMGILRAEEARFVPDDDINKLIFTAGLSSAAQTDTLAGRGVGLDVVRSVLERIGGSVRIDSRRGVGTRVYLQLPITTTLVKTLTVKIAGRNYQIPSSSVVEVQRITVKEVRRIDGRENMLFREKLLPLWRLREVFGLTGIKDVFMNELGVVVLRWGDELGGFIVDGFGGDRDVVSRPFPAILGRPRFVSGITLADRGELVPILYVADLFGAVRSGSYRRGLEGATMSATANERILFVDDSFITREYLASVLRSMGFTVEEAGDGIEALEALHRDHFDLVLSDVQMPRMDGFKLVKTIREDPALRGLPVIVMSTLEGEEARRMALDAGADAYIVKMTYAPDLLLGTIRRVLG